MKNLYILEDRKEALKYCEEALEVYKKNNLSNEYLSSLIHKNIAECYNHISVYDYEQIVEEKEKCNYYLVAQVQSKEKDIDGKMINEENYIQKENNKEKQLEKAIEIWREAAEEYRYLENWEMMEQCYLKVLSFLEPVLYQYEWSHFEYYWHISTDRLLGICQQNHREQLMEQSKLLLEELIYYKFKLDNKWKDELNEKERIKDNAYDFASKLCELADYLAQVNYNMEAFLLYILAIIVYIEHLPKKSLCQEVCKYLKLEKDVKSFKNSFSSFEKNILYKEWERVLHCTIEENMVDMLLNLWKKIEELTMPQEIISKYEMTMQWFLDTYKYQNIEFKR